MNSKLKRTLCGLSALVMLAGLSSCASGTEGRSSAQETSPAGEGQTADGGAEDTSADPSDPAVSVVTTRAREEIATEPVVETLGDFDLSEYSDGDVPEDYSFEAEAEKCELSGGASVIDKAFVGKFTGDGFIAVMGEGIGEMEIDFPASGSYDLTIRSASDSEDTKAQITVDGAALTTFDVPSDKFDDNKAEKVRFPEGKHKIGFKSQSSAPVYIDSFTIKPAEKIDPAQFEVSRELVNPNANEETRRLYSFLCDTYGKYILSGQYSKDNWGTESREFIEIEKLCGDYPAVQGIDLIELSPSRLRHGSGGGETAIRNAKSWWNDYGGIVTICWHWNAPDKYLYENDNEHPWWRGFYSDSTTINLGKIMNGEDQEGYDMLVQDIDSIAEYLKELEDYHVPVLWRPLHEGGGDPIWNNTWFWWGSSGGEAYKELWKLMYDRLTNYHHLNNLIWVWNGQNPAYYPGDEYCDIIGFDVYADKGDYSSKKWYYDFTKDCASSNKIVAMTENGTLFDPDAAMADGTRWSYFATWNGEFTVKDAQLSGEYTSLDMWEKIYNHDRVLTLKELPDLKNYPLDSKAFLDK